MDCALIGPELFAYHVGALEEEVRGRVDAHLLQCTECLRTYLALKHHVDRGGSAAARPSDALRERLRADVQAAFRRPVRERAFRLLNRPVPLYQGLAVAALAVAIVMLAPVVAQRHGHGPADRASAGERVDTSRTTPESVTFY
jgi:anti-sigma factor RsiW